jgi:hypothetical protein
MELNNESPTVIFYRANKIKIPFVALVKKNYLSHSSSSGHLIPKVSINFLQSEYTFSQNLRQGGTT